MSAHPKNRRLGSSLFYNIATLRTYLSLECAVERHPYLSKERSTSPSPSILVKKGVRRKELTSAVGSAPVTLLPP